MLKITHKIALLIIVPLMIELCFLGVVMATLEEVERDRRAESRAVESLVYVNLILNDAWTAANSMMMFRATKTEQFILDFKDLSKSLERHTDRLKQLGEASAPHEKEIDRFVSIVDQLVKALDKAVHLVDDSYEISNIHLIGRVKGYVSKMNLVSQKVIEQQSQARQRYQEKQTLSRGRLKLIIEAAALANVVAAVALAIVFSFTFARRFNVLMNNTMNIAIGKPLVAPLEGSDELARLDGVIHNLSSELDITREKERAMIDNSAVIICCLNESLRISEINPAMGAQLGFTTPELLGTNLISLVHEEDRDDTWEGLTLCKETNKTYEFEARVRTASGRFIYSEWTVKWAENSKSIFCVVHNITERKEAEKFKQEVIAMVSHDLRAPLTSLGVVLDMMLEGVAGSLNDRGTRMVGLAKQSVSSLISMINDLLDVERYESGGLALDYEQTNIKRLVDNAIEMVKPEADKKNVTIRTEVEDLKATVDIDRITRVLVNLLGNAAKFSPDDSTVTLTAKPVEHEDSWNWLELEVIDEGPGIPEEKRDVVFEKFRQVGKSSEAEKKGSGLGLAICKAITEAHQGQIGVVSVEGEGSTFWLRIPINPDRPVAA